MAKANDKVIAGEQELGKLDYEKAFKHFSEAIKIDPKEARAYFGKAEASVGMPKVKPEEIAAMYKKAIDLEPKNPQYLEAYANFCMECGRFNEAEELYNKVAQLDKENAPFYYTDFAVKYYTIAPQVMENLMDDQGKEIVAKKSLGYLLKALNIEKDYAKRLLE